MDIAFAEGRLERFMDESKVVYKWTGCMLDEEGARMLEEKTEWIEGIDGTRYRTCSFDGAVCKYT